MSVTLDEIFSDPKEGEEKPIKDPQEIEEQIPEETPKEEAKSESEDPTLEGEGDKATPEKPTSTTVPFHMNPRWRRMQEEKSALESKVAELERLVQGIHKPREEQERMVPDHLQRIFGDDFDAYSAWHGEQVKIAQSAVAEREQKQLALQEAKEREEHEFRSWAENVFTELSEQTGENLNDVKNDTRNKILDICEKYGVVGDDGRPDFHKAFELYGVLYPSIPVDDAKKERRELAVKTKDNQGTPGKEQEVLTRSTLRTKSLKDFF